jgi:hypothetical protein
MNRSLPEEWNPVTDGFHRVKNIHNPTLTVFLPTVAITTW